MHRVYGASGRAQAGRAGCVAPLSFVCARFVVSCATRAEATKLSDSPSADEIKAASKDMLQEFSERSPANYQIVYQEFVRRKFIFARRRRR